MPQKQQEPRAQRPPQQQGRQPGIEKDMRPKPQAEDAGYRGSGKLSDKVAILTGGDSGIGRSVAIFFAREGADVAIVYYNEHEDAQETRRQVEQEGRRCFLIPGDVGDEGFCKTAVQKTVGEFGKINILVNNAAEQHMQAEFLHISPEQLERTFRTNIFAYFYMAQAVLSHLGKGDVIINTTSVTAYRGSAHLIDYAATKGAIVAFTRSLAHALVEKEIRVNGVAPGPVWTPLIPATFPADKVATFGSDVPMGRAAQPEEIAPSYVFLACDDSSYYTGQILHPNGGEIING